MTEIVCTCPKDWIAANPASHLDGCSMRTGVPAGTFTTAISPGTHRIVGMDEWQELSSPEPPLARSLRARVEDEEIVTVHVLDGSAISGRAVAVSEDGLVVTLVEGRDLYEIDVEKITVVQTLRRGKFSTDGRPQE